MVYLPSNLPALLRAAGLKVVEIDGWKTRGRPASTGSFNPVGVLNHHTGASANGWSLAKELSYARWMFLTGRSDLPAPLCNLALGRSGTVYVGAAGRANHAGTAKASGSVGAGDGNSLYIGIEWMLSGSEAIPANMMQAAIALNAVLTEKATDNQRGTTVATISCHYNTSVTGKWDIGDPNGVPFNGKKVLDIAKFRKAVQSKRDDLYSRPKPPKPELSSTEILVGHFSCEFKDSPAQWRHDADVIFSRGYTWVTGTEAGDDANWKALSASAKKHGYRIKRFKANWVAVRKSARQAGSLRWFTQTVVSNDEQVGKHTSDLSFVGATFKHKTKGVGKLSTLASHYWTDGRPGSDSANLRSNKKLAAGIVAKMTALGKAAVLSFMGADFNTNLAKDDPFYGGPVTLSWQVVKKYPRTGPVDCIDGIGSLDSNARVTCIAADAFGDQELFLHGDHSLVQTRYRIKHK